MQSNAWLRWIAVALIPLAVRDVTLEGDTRIFDWARLTSTVQPSAARLGPLLASNDAMMTSAP